MLPNEVIRTSGDVRRTLAQCINDVRSGALSVDKGNCVAGLAKELTASMQAEVNVAKVKISLLSSGADLGKIAHLGHLVIDQESSTPTLSGK